MRNGAVFWRHKTGKHKEFYMSLVCLASYFVAALLFTSLFWMSLVVGRKQDEKNDPSQAIELAWSGD